MISLHPQLLLKKFHPSLEKMVPKIGRAHVRTPVTFRNLVCRLLLEKKKDPDFSINYDAWQVELLGQLGLPLLADVRRYDDDLPPLALCPLLAEDQSSLDRLAEPQL